MRQTASLTTRTARQQHPVEAALEVPPGGSSHDQQEELTTTPSASTIRGDAAEALRAIKQGEVAPALDDGNITRAQGAIDVTKTDDERSATLHESDAERQREDFDSQRDAEAAFLRDFQDMMNKNGALQTTVGMAPDLGTVEAALEVPPVSDSRARQPFRSLSSQFPAETMLCRIVPAGLTMTGETTMDKGIQWTDAQALAHAACCALLPPTRLSGVGASPAVAGVTGNDVCNGETYIVVDGK